MLLQSPVGFQLGLKSQPEAETYHLALLSSRSAQGFGGKPLPYVALLKISLIIISLSQL